MFCFCVWFEVGIISFAENSFFALVFLFLEFSCWLSTTYNLIWIFVAFVAFIEVVGLWLASVIVTGIPGLLADKDFFLCSFKNELSFYNMTPHNIYKFPSPILFLFSHNKLWSWLLFARILVNSNLVMAFNSE